MNFFSQMHPHSGGNHSDSDHESTLSADMGDSEHQHQAEKGKDIQPKDLVRSYLQGSWFGIYGTAVKDDVISEWINIAIICGLCAGFGGSGFFADLPEHAVDNYPGLRRAFLVTQCFATLGMLTATLGYLFLVIAGTETSSTAQFRAWAKYLGCYARIPLLIAMTSAAALYLGVCLYFILKCGIEVATHCIASCLALLFLPLLTSSVATVWSVLKIRADSASDQKLSHVDADMIYDMLRKYFEEHCGGSVFQLKRDDFVHQFHLNGEVAQMLAHKIYDSWLEHKLASMIRADPGF